VFNFDTPWHPDDYIHRIGRTGRGGATGRAVTLVSDEDAEAIANVEKLTGMVIPTIALGSAPAIEPVDADLPEAAPRQRAGKGAVAKAPDRGRKARGGKPKPEIAPPAESPRESPAEPPEQPKSSARRASASAAPIPDAREATLPEPTMRVPVPATGDTALWNGPIPGFLHVSALTEAA
jgi:superfamily II DNA/RNA helicase